MKVKSLKKRNSLIIGFKGEKPIKERNWDRLVYITLLIILSGIGMHYLAGYLLYASGKGQVLMGTLDTKVPGNIRIMYYYKSEGDEVNENDTLFSYITENSVSSNVTDSSGLYAPVNPEWLEKQLFSWKERVELNESEIEELRHQLKSKKIDYNEALVQVKLNILSFDNLYKLKEKVEVVQNRIAVLSQENKVILRQAESSIEKLKNCALKEKAYFTAAIQQNLSVNNNVHFYQSPVKGIISNILKRASELSFQESILLVQREDELFVRAYFDSKFVNSIKENDTVNIIFPDEARGKGIVRRLHVPVLPQGHEMHNGTELEESVYGVDIYPLNVQEGKAWKIYNSLNVKVFKSKFK